MKRWIVVAWVLTALPVYGQPVIIDGDFGDWDPAWRADVNPIPTPEVTGDHSVDPSNPTKYVDTDISQIYVTDDQNYLYFRLTFNDSANLWLLQDTTLYNGAAAISIYFDLDADSSTGMTWGWWGSGYDFLAVITHTPEVQAPWGPMPDAFGLYEYDQTQHPNWGFNPVTDTAIALISVDPPYNQIEAAIPKSVISGLSSQIRFLIVVQEQLDPWGGDYAPDADNLGYQVYSYSLQNLPDAGITIDGDFTDWASVDPMGAPLALYNEVEPTDDHSVDPNNPDRYVDTDIDGIYSIADNNYLYFYLDFNPNADLYNLQDTTLYHGAAAVSIFIDVDNDSATGLTWGWWASGFDFLATVTHTPQVQSLPDAFGLYVYDQAQHPNWGFTPISDTAMAAISVDPPYNKIEFAIPRSVIPNLPATGEVSILAVAQEQLDPWGGDYAPDAWDLGYQVMRVSTTPVNVEERDVREITPSALRVLTPVATHNLLFVVQPKRRENAEILLYDLVGRRVQTLYHGVLNPETHQFSIPLNTLPSGLYWIVLKSKAETYTRKFTVVK